MKLLLFTGILFFVNSCTHTTAQKFSFSARKMGVDFRIDLFAENKTEAEKAASKAFARIDEINQIMSDYIVDSELWRISETSGSGKKVKVSPEMWEILTFSKEIHSISNGAFDITAGPYVLLWRKARVIKRFPDERSMHRAANRVGMDKILLHENDKRVELTASNMRLDLGGVAKGYAADEALKTLQNNGIKFALVDGSGDISMTAHPENGWTVYVSDNSKKEGVPLQLSNCSIATSGDTFQNVEIDGKKYSHIINPKTGYGVTGSYRVTVIAADGKSADALASAITVMGPEKGLAMVENLSGVEALVSKIENGKRISFKSSGFPNINF